MQIFARVESTCRSGQRDQSNPSRGSIYCVASQPWKVNRYEMLLIFSLII